MKIEIEANDKVWDKWFQHVYVQLGIVKSMKSLGCCMWLGISFAKSSNWTNLTLLR